MICSDNITEGKPDEVITIIVSRKGNKKYLASMHYCASEISILFEDNVFGLITFRDFLEMVRTQFKPEKLKVKIHETRNIRNATFFGIADCID